VFGRHTPSVVVAVALTAVTLGLLATGRADLRLREPIRVRAAPLPIEFDHAKHRAVNCVACHHNYVDGRGFDACIDCHRRDTTHIKVGIEARFHDFCLDCHRHPAPALGHHGPVSGCFACHRPDASFH
jgi:predicted CXXCH cytochrome family protein